MTILLKKLLFLILAFEGILFLLLYFFGPNGLHLLSQLDNQKQIVLTEIAQLEGKKVKLEQELKASQSNFAKEKMARERLLMKKENETVFFKNSMKDKKNV